MAQLALIVGSVGLFAHLGMVVHELGHVAGAWAVGLAVESVHVPPFGFSETRVAAVPRPVVVVAGGFLVGVAVPMLAWGLAAWIGWRYAWLLRFFAGLALVGNGGYLGFGWLAGGYNDGTELVNAGVPGAVLAAIGAAMMAGGLAAWHGQGRRFGIGGTAGPVDRRTAVGVVAAAAGLLLAQTVWTAAGG